MGIQTCELYFCDFCPKQHRTDVYSPLGWFTVEPCYRVDMNEAPSQIMCYDCHRRLRAQGMVGGGGAAAQDIAIGMSVSGAGLPDGAKIIADSLLPLESTDDKSPHLFMDGGQRRAEESVKKGRSKYACEVALQLWRCGPIWDGYLVSKTGRDELVVEGLVIRQKDGFNFLTLAGVNVMAACYGVSE